MILASKKLIATAQMTCGYAIAALRFFLAQAFANLGHAQLPI
jgi:hypothetical protein